MLAVEEEIMQVQETKATRAEVSLISDNEDDATSERCHQALATSLSRDIDFKLEGQRSFD